MASTRRRAAILAADVAVYDIVRPRGTKSSNPSLSSRESANLRFLRPPRPRRETRSGVGRTRGIDGSNPGEAAKLESAKRAEELAADGDLASVAVGLRIIDATGPLAITTPCGAVH